MSLTFHHLREVNVARCVEGWKHPLGSWSLDEWLVALGGELGEAMNVLKKLHRDRDGIIGNDRPASILRSEFADELADTVIYLDLTAASQGVQLFSRDETFAHLLEHADIRPHLALPPARHMATAWRALARASSVLQMREFFELRGAAPAGARSEDAADYLEGGLISLAATARHYAIDLGGAVVDKFNRTSFKHDMPHRLVPS